jgi:hypothetical protein
LVQATRDKFPVVLLVKYRLFPLKKMPPTPENVPGTVPPCPLTMPLSGENARQMIDEEFARVT